MKISLGVSVNRATLVLLACIALGGCASVYLATYGPLTTIHDDFRDERKAFELREPTQPYRLAYQFAERCEYRYVIRPSRKLPLTGMEKVEYTDGSAHQVYRDLVVSSSKIGDAWRLSHSLNGATSSLLIDDAGKRIDYNIVDFSGDRRTPEDVASLRVSDVESLEVPYPHFTRSEVPRIGETVATIQNGSIFAREYQFVGAMDYQGKEVLVFDILAASNITIDGRRLDKKRQHGFVLYEASSMIPVLVTYGADRFQYQASLVRCE
jgi:hypothetical protein